MTFLHVPDLARLDLDVGRLTARAAERLVDHDAGVRQRVAPALGARPPRSTARHRRRLPEAHRADTAQRTYCIVS